MIYTGLLSLLLAEYAANQKCSAVLLCSADSIYPLLEGRLKARCAQGRRIDVIMRSPESSSPEGSKHKRPLLLCKFAYFKPILENFDATFANASNWLVSSLLTVLPVLIFIIFLFHHVISPLSCKHNLDMLECQRVGLGYQW